MTNEEMQVLRALETGLELAEAQLAEEECNPLAKYRPRLLDCAQEDVQQIKAAIEVVKRWETKE